MGEPAIRIDKLTVRFGEQPVLERFSLGLDTGAKATLTGRSGSGKSTVLRCIMGFVVPDAGAVHIEGERLTGESVWRLRAKLAYVAQEPDIGAGTVREVLERPFGYRANAHLEDNLAQAPALFERFLLPQALLDKDVTALSGGEKQRVAVISCLLLDRRIVLLDEASSALDDAAAEAVAGYFRSRENLTVLSVSHDRRGFYFSDHTIALPGGDEETRHGRS